MEADGSHPGRTLGLTTAELKHLLQSKEETPENLLLDLEKHVMVKESKQVDVRVLYLNMFLKQYRLSPLNEKGVQFCGISCGPGNSCWHCFNNDVQNHLF